MGRPPMAYTSLSALAAAMAPKVSGSSTMGVKKSTVCTRASSAVSLYTPASSAVSNPISTFSSGQRGTVASTWSKTFGLSLDAQPAAFTCAVSFFSWVCSTIGLDAFTIIAGMRRTSLFSVALLLALAISLVSREPQTDPRLKKASRRPSAAAGFRSTWRGRPRRSVFSTATCWRPKSPTTTKRSPPRSRTTRKKTGPSSARRRRRFSGRTSSRSTARS
jgi:hypothetical protein